jgi:hypothetical protein
LPIVCRILRGWSQERVSRLAAGRPAELVMCMTRSQSVGFCQYRCTPASLRHGFALRRHMRHEGRETSRCSDGLKSTAGVVEAALLLALRAFPVTLCIFVSVCLCERACFALTGKGRDREYTKPIVGAAR